MSESDNAFSILGLEPRFRLELRELEQKQRESYLASSGLGALALEAINDAYRLLKNPVTRAELLFELRGWSMTSRPTPRFLEQIFAEREAIEQAKLRRDERFLLDWVSSARTRRESLVKSLGQLLDEPAHDDAESVARSASLLDELRYLSRALAAAEAALHVLEEASILP